MIDEEFNTAAADHDFDGIMSRVSAGANPDAPVAGFGTLLIYAVTQGQQSLVEHLVRAGAHVDLPDDKGNTPLIHAARLGLQDIVEYLLEARANALVKNTSGVTAYEAARDAGKELETKFDDSTMSVDDVQNEFSRIARIASIIREAEPQRRLDDAIASHVDACHAGVPAAVTINQPIRFKEPGA
jgi:hypothetical protein